MNHLIVARKVWNRLLRAFGRSLLVIDGVTYEEDERGACMSFTESPILIEILTRAFAKYRSAAPPSAEALDDSDIVWVMLFLPKCCRFRCRAIEPAKFADEWERDYSAPDLMKRIGKELDNLGLLPDDWPQDELYGEGEES